MRAKQQNCKTGASAPELYVLREVYGSGLLGVEYVEEMDLEEHTPAWTATVENAMRGSLYAMQVLGRLINNYSGERRRVVLVPEAAEAWAEHVRKAA